jgi:2-phospho-L-lactate/phosphoenolpyruvate guanylyltransferase
VTLILILCKALDRGKLRLAPVLDAADRARLCEDFLRRTLSVAVASAGADAVRIISADERVVQISADAGVRVLSCESGDLNRTLESARRTITAEGPAHDCLILPIDLPNISVRSLRSIIHVGEAIAIAPDRRRQGTNALLLSADIFKKFPFLFGIGSFTKHLEAARLAGFSCKVIDDRDLAFDVDEPDDYREWLRVKANAALSSL